MTPETTKVLQDTIELLNGVLFANWRENAKDIVRRAQHVLAQPPTDAQILAHYSKNGNKFYLADTPERLAAAKAELFTTLDDQGCYDHTTPDISRARDGDPQAIANILKARRYQEYEEWELVAATDATRSQP